MREGALADLLKILMFAGIAYVIVAKVIIDRVTGRRSEASSDDWVGDDGHHGAGHGSGDDGGGHH